MKDPCTLPPASIDHANPGRAFVPVPFDWPTLYRQVELIQELGTMSPDTIREFEFTGDHIKTLYQVGQFLKHFERGVYYVMAETSTANRSTY
jgi:hypothetical protein